MKHWALGNFGGLASILGKIKTPKKSCSPQLVYVFSSCPKNQETIYEIHTLISLALYGTIKRKNDKLLPT